MLIKMMNSVWEVWKSKAIKMIRSGGTLMWNYYEHIVNCIKEMKNDGSVHTQCW